MVRAALIRLAGILLLPGLASTAGSGQTPAARPSLSDWSAQAETAVGTFPRRMTFVLELPATMANGLKFVPFDHEEFNRQSFIKAADSRTADWDLKLNRAAMSRLDAVAAITALTKADVIVVAPAKGSWLLVLPGKDGKPTKVAKAASTKAGDLVAWLPQALGWDGVVLGRQGDALLVGSTAPLLGQPDLQALAVAQSAGAMVLDKDKRAGAGLLSLTETREGLGIFDIVFLGQDVKDIPIGTKLIIERRKK